MFFKILFLFSVFNYGRCRGAPSGSPWRIFAILKRYITHVVYATPARDAKTDGQRDGRATVIGRKKKYTLEPDRKCHRTWCERVDMLLLIVVVVVDVVLDVVPVNGDVVVVVVHVVVVIDVVPVAVTVVAVVIVVRFIHLSTSVFILRIFLSRQSARLCFFSLSFFRFLLCFFVFGFVFCITRHLDRRRSFLRFPLDRR